MLLTGIASRDRSTTELLIWIGKRHVIEVNAGGEGNVRSSIVHVVALDALVHDAESATDDGLAVSTDVIGKSDAGTKGEPVVIY